VQSGPATEVLTQPANERAARLLDIPNIFSARVETKPTGRTVLLRWGPHTLRAVGDSLSDGAEVRWTILPVNVLLVRPDKPWGSHLENPLPATVLDSLELGAETVVWLEPEGIETERLQMRLPTRAIRRHALVAGKPVTVSLRVSEIVVFNVG
jgi:molybdate transport system ATP-binding protein